MFPLCPNCPGVYALIGGNSKREYIAYVGITRTLRQRLIQHLVNQDTSIATGTAAVGLKPQYVTKVKWWTHPDFSDSSALQAAALVAFDVFEPILRSRGKVRKNALALYRKQSFRQRMITLFSKQPSGYVVVPSLMQLSEKIDTLERRLVHLEAHGKAALPGK
jgi:hypothetical protein